MCGRYVLALPAREVRQRLMDYGMPVDEVPEDDAARQGYNIAPGYYELIYRADVPDYGAGERHHKKDAGNSSQVHEEAEEQHTGQPNEERAKETKYKLQAMKWGLVPFWTKRNPDYSSMLRTINCRDDSLAQNTGMWTTMKQRKRCIVVCQGFYEWLKKGKDKVPHYVKRKDGKLMCFAGLWDCVQYKGSEEKLYTYTIITTDSNAQLKFLHDRMPVIFEPNSPELRTWLDPSRSTWTKELQSLLKPYAGGLEVYPVSKEVGKVGNNSPSFIIPIDSSENKNNIANFFGNAKGGPKKSENKDLKSKKEEENDVPEQDESRETVDHTGMEDNAPLPVPASHKRGYEDIEDTTPPPASKAPKKEGPTPFKKEDPSTSPTILKSSKTATTTTRKTRSATSNNIVKKSPSKAIAGAGKGSQKITRFFSK